MYAVSMTAAAQSGTNLAIGRLVPPQLEPVVVAQQRLGDLWSDRCAGGCNYEGGCKVIKQPAVRLASHTL